jgi:hypothetical protein
MIRYNKLTSYGILSTTKARQKSSSRFPLAARALRLRELLRLSTSHALARSAASLMARFAITFAR